MSVLDVIRKRRSTRKYKTDFVPDEVFLRVMEAARLAPSGKNLQPWHFIVVKDAKLKEELAVASAHQYFIADAPMIIVACAYPENSYARMGRYMRSWPVDVAIAVWRWGKYLGEGALEKGVPVRISSWSRMAPNTFPPMAKSGGNYMNSQLIKMEALLDGYV